jgi:tripartite-type tricarboxylate transporter receptor subunit TctC
MLKFAKKFGWVFAPLAALFAVGTVAPAFPEKAIRMVVPWKARD